MAPVFKTRSDSKTDVEIAGVGFLASGGRGGIPADAVAEVAHELQDAKGRPLTGKRLAEAAKDFADSRGIDVREVKDPDREALAEEAGAFPLRPKIEDVARSIAERDERQVAETGAPLTKEDVPARDVDVAPEPPTGG